MYVCIPSRVGGPPEQLFTIQRQKTKSRSNIETKNPFPFRHPAPVSVASFPHPPLPGISQPSWGVYLTACPRTWGLSPLPLPTGPGEAPSHPKMLLPRWLRCPLEFLLLVHCFWDSAWEEGADFPPREVERGRKMRAAGFDR